MKFQTQLFVDNELHVAKMMGFPMKRVENIVGKGENSGNEHKYPLRMVFYAFCDRKKKPYYLICHLLMISELEYSKTLSFGKCQVMAKHIQ